MKLNVKRMLFIALCAELLLLYWTRAEYKEQKQEVVFHQQQVEMSSPEKTGNKAPQPFKKHES